MITEEKKALKELKSMFEGMLYHCKEMIDWLDKNDENPIFETELGKKLKSNMIGITGNHAMGLMNIVINDMKKDDVVKNTFDGGIAFEEMIKKSLEDKGL